MGGSPASTSSDLPHPRDAEEADCRQVLPALPSESRGRDRDDEGEPVRMWNRACTLLRKCYSWQAWRAGLPSSRDRLGGKATVKRSPVLQDGVVKTEDEW